MRRNLIIADKTIDIYQAESPCAPMVILNSYQRAGEELLKQCAELGCPDFTLVEISGLVWNDEMSPWTIPSLSRDEPPFGGKANNYLGLLIGEILPAVKAELDTEPRSILLAGYSLAGLFALYAATKSDLFAAVASCSGSMWFPGFMEYIKQQDITTFTKHIYFSLGDREARTKNEILRTVEDNTKELAAYLSQGGINTVFEQNKGNHFHQGTLRTAKGIRWILSHTE